MPAPPPRNKISDIYPNPSNGVAREGLGAFYDYVTPLLGSTGNAPEARTALGAAPVASPAFTGNPTAPTPATTDNDTSIATTEFVQKLIGDPWTAVTAGPTAGSGAFSNASYTLRHRVIGKTAYFNLVVAILANGTAGGSVIVALPWAAKTESSFAGRESQSTGALCGATVAAGSTALVIQKYDNSYPGGSGYRIALNGVLEIA